MGCGNSKQVAVKDNTSLVIPFNDNSKENSVLNDEDTTEINVFINTDNTDADTVNLSTNAKPRLIRSAIRRNTHDSLIRPVLPEPSNSRGPEKDEFALTSTNSRCSDSGFGNTSTSSFSENSERSKSSPANLPNKAKSRSNIKTPIFSMKPPENSQRPDSAQTGSILTTSALNASFMTTGDDEITDLSLDLHTPYSELMDFEETSLSQRTMSITPSTRGTSVEPTPSFLHTKQFGAIREESEGGFTPRSIDSLDDKGKMASVQNGVLTKYLPRDVFSHNTKAGCKDWILYKGKIYKTDLIISKFSPLVQEYLESKQSEMEQLRQNATQRRKEKYQNGNTKSRNRDVTESNQYNLGMDGDSDSDWDSLGEEEEEEYSEVQNCIQKWDSFRQRCDGISTGIEMLLAFHFDEECFNNLLCACCVGELVQPNSSRYWEDVRGDVRMLLDHLNRAEARDDIKNYEREYKEQLQGWLRQYHDHNPNASHVNDGDPNVYVFPLPSFVESNPESLRLWIEQWVQFDCEVPENGAWQRYEVMEVDLGDPDEIFKAMLRGCYDKFEPLEYDIGGVAAWHVLPENVIAHDILTPNQEAVEESRRYRSDLDDPKRMERRRNTLLRYFVMKYEMRPSDVEHFTRWARAMEDGDRKFKELCGLV